MDDNEFKYRGCLLAAQEGKNSCEGCFFESMEFDCEEMKDKEIIPFCTELCRDDMRDVIFVEKQQ